jgi:hypothetical protein
MQTTNPIFERDVLDKYRRDFHIVGLYKNRLNDAVFDPVSAFCLENGIAFRLEAFSSGVEEDRECVLRLPAFHVYFKEEYETTFYLEDSVKKVLLGCIARFAKKETWWPSFNFTLFKRRRVAVLSHEN